MCLTHLSLTHMPLTHMSDAYASDTYVSDTHTYNAYVADACRRCSQDGRVKGALRQVAGAVRGVFWPRPPSDAGRKGPAGVGLANWQRGLPPASLQG